MFSVFAVGGKQETRLGGNIGGQKPDQCIQIKWVILMTLRGTIIIHSLSPYALQCRRVMYPSTNKGGGT